MGAKVEANTTAIINTTKRLLSCHSNISSKKIATAMTIVKLEMTMRRSAIILVHVPAKLRSRMT